MTEPFPIDANSKMIHTYAYRWTRPCWRMDGKQRQNVCMDNETSQTISEITVSSMSVTATINLGFKPGYAASQLFK